MTQVASGSTPTLSEFDPALIPFQMRVVNDIRGRLDYSKGVQEILLSGSVGSAKSILMAHLIVTHCLMYPKAKALIGRLALPDLKDTLIQMILEHIEEDLVEGRDYWHNKHPFKIKFSNGSQIIARTWHDKKFRKFRSQALSIAAVEEGTENTEEYKEFYFELVQRIGRLPHVPESWIMVATNPDAPSHWLYKHFFVEQKEDRHVYLSRTHENPFLPTSYIEKLKSTLDPKQARRMLYGEWIELADEVVYYNYDRDRNFIDANPEIHPHIPIDLSHDFNIGEGKPMSANVSQYKGETFHFLRTFAVDGARTTDIMDEIAASGLLDMPNTHIRVFGDASGKSRDTRSIKSDYQIIKEYLDNYQRKDGQNLKVEMMVPLSNPPIRDRHNLVNAQFKDANGKVKCFVYKGAATLDEGFRLTKLKKGGNYIEDDSFRAQHCTTAAGYMIHYLLKRMQPQKKAYVRG